MTSEQAATIIGQLSDLAAGVELLAAVLVNLAKAAGLLVGIALAVLVSWRFHKPGWFGEGLYERDN